MVPTVNVESIIARLRRKYGFARLKHVRIEGDKVVYFIDVSGVRAKVYVYRNGKVWVKCPVKSLSLSIKREFQSRRRCFRR